MSSYEGGWDQGMADRLREWGLNVVEVDGWRERGRSTPRFGGHVSHHTADGPRGVAPSLGLVIHGGSNTAPGPLANVLQGRADDGDDPIFVIAAGTANHAGTGGWGPLSGNSTVWGNEIEHTGREELPEHRVRIACRVAAALMSGTANADMHCQHYEWNGVGGKIDVAEAPGGGSVDGDLWRQITAEILAAGPGGSTPVPPSGPANYDVEEATMLATYQESDSGDECILAIEGDALWHRRNRGGAWSAWSRVGFQDGTPVMVDRDGGITRTRANNGVLFPYFLVLGKPEDSGKPTMLKVDLGNQPFGVPLAVAI